MQGGWRKSRYLSFFHLWLWLVVLVVLVVMVLVVVVVVGWIARDLLRLKKYSSHLSSLILLLTVHYITRLLFSTSVPCVPIQHVEGITGSLGEECMCWILIWALNLGGALMSNCSPLSHIGTNVPLKKNPHIYLISVMSRFSSGEMDNIKKLLYS